MSRPTTSHSSTSRIHMPQGTQNSDLSPDTIAEMDRILEGDEYHTLSPEQLAEIDEALRDKTSDLSPEILAAMNRILDEDDRDR